MRTPQARLSTFRGDAHQLGATTPAGNWSASGATGGETSFPLPVSRVGASHLALRGSHGAAGQVTAYAFGVDRLSVRWPLYRAAGEVATPLKNKANHGLATVAAPTHPRHFN